MTSNTIHDILREFREAARDKRDLGDKFERLFANYLVTEPYYKDRFSLNDLGEHNIRGKAEAIRVYRLLSVSLPDPNAPDSSEALD